MSKYQCNAYDPDVGAARVYGVGTTPAKAETMCRWQLKEYCEQRREWKPEQFKLETFWRGA